MYWYVFVFLYCSNVLMMDEGGRAALGAALRWVKLTETDGGLTSCLRMYRYRYSNGTCTGTSATVPVPGTGTHSTVIEYR